MRIAVLIAAAATVLTLSACNRTDEAAIEGSTEAAEASGGDADTAALSADQAAAAAAAAADAPGVPTSETAGQAVAGTVRELDPPPAH